MIQFKHEGIVGFYNERQDHVRYGNIGCQFSACGPELKNSIRKAKRNETRRSRDQAMRDVGLTKVRVALGGTYWE